MAKVTLSQQAEVDLLQEITAKIEADVDQIVIDAKQLVPVLTGKLRDSIKKVEPTVGNFSVIADTDYALFVELGTGKMPAKPFLRKALDKFRQKYM